jgi:hypothetical protein
MWNPCIQRANCPPELAKAVQLDLGSTTGAALNEGLCELAMLPTAQGLELARQVLYLLSHAPNPFCVSCFHGPAFFAQTSILLLLLPT